MGITKDRGRYYWVKRVPKRYLGLVCSADGRPVSQVRVALRTDSASEARRKAAAVEVARLAEWEALLQGNSGSAREHYLAARRLAEARGFAYVPVAQLAEEICTRSSGGSCRLSGTVVRSRRRWPTPSLALSSRSSQG